MGASAVTVKVSDDGKNFKEVASKKIPELTQNDKDGLYPQEISFAPVKARYVEVIINSGKLPKWHGGAGSPAFLFVDEIEIL
jgi:hexosaminidase